METFLITTEVITLILTSLAFLYCVAIVWRVEGELDSSYKCFAIAIIAFLISELLRVYYSQDESLLVFEMIIRAIYALFLLAGILYMRDIVKYIDVKENRRSKK